MLQGPVHVSNMHRWQFSLLNPEVTGGNARFKNHLFIIHVASISYM